MDTDTHRIFHAGDLNWWHWSGDTPENIAEAKALKEKEFAPLLGLSVDIMMFPVDARLSRLVNGSPRSIRDDEHETIYSYAC